MQKLAREHDIKIHSAGIHALDGFPASDNCLRVVRENGLNLSDHRSRSISEDLLREADLVLAMSEEHMDFIRIFYPLYFDKVYLLRRFGREHEENSEAVIHDPIGGDLTIYKECYTILTQEILRIMEFIEGQNRTLFSDF